MRILYIAKFGKNNTETHIADELVRQGCKVERVVVDGDPFKALQDTHEHDIVLFGKLPETWRGFVKNCHIPTYCWIFDVYPFRTRTLKEAQFEADYVVSTGGIDNTEVIRQAIPQDHKEMFEYEKKFDVLFIGSLYTGDRLRLDEYLLNQYEGKYYQFGDKLQIRGKDLNHVLGQTKIAVGDSYPKPGYWSNRVYEICGRGGFIIHPEVEGLKDEFPDIVTYKHNDFDDLQSKIDYYLEHEDEREEIRNKCFTSCPTFKERVKDFIKLTKNYG